MEAVVAAGSTNTTEKIEPRRRRQRAGKGLMAVNPELESGKDKKRSYGLKSWNRDRNRNRNRNRRLSGEMNGQPPAGWVVLWEGRFKRWKRRWFSAHRPGLLLYYKNHEQLSQTGFISLEGAHVSLVAGKERQLKIRRGSQIYYLRTLNRENRQAWLETINKSISTYERSRQKVSLGDKSERVQDSHQHLPSHLAEEWRQQEIEVKRRIAERMQELEPIKQAFLQQLQTIQKSLSDISGALGFTTNYITGVCPRNEETFMKEPNSVDTHLPPANLNENGRSPSIGKIQVDLLGEGPTPHYVSTEEIGIIEEIKTSECETAETDSQLKKAGCIGREMFRLKRRETIGVLSPVEKGHYSSDTEVLLRSSVPKRLSNSNISDMTSKPKHQHDRLSVSRSVDNFTLNHINELPGKDAVSHDMKTVIDIQSSNKIENNNAYLQRGNVQNQSHFVIPPNLADHPTQGQLQKSWNVMQETFAEILKEEIQRVIELEAENAALQQSLVMLPQLQQDHRDLLDLKEQIQRDKTCKISTTDDIYVDGEYGDDEDTDDEISIVLTDVTNEDYFEALEVLNQHEFISKSKSEVDLEIPAEKFEYSEEPPEEGDSIDIENLSEVEAEDYEQPRTRLPAPRPLQRGFSLWSVLKNAIGKDLNHITMPATINEPLSVLQRCAEELQYSNLLEKASQLDDSIERLVWVSVFTCATYHGSPHRDAKPFNPLLGETYEWQDGRLRFIAEQVSHHPPIMAFHCDNVVNDFSLYGEVEIKNKFWGKSVEVFPVGNMHLRMSRFGDHFTWNKVTTCIHNMVVGKLWIDNYGECVIRNHTTGEESRIRFHKANSKEQGHITGKICDSKGILKCSIHGNYMKEISIIPEASWTVYDGGSKCLWKCPSPPDDYQQQYCFSQFTIGLNELTPQLSNKLPPTDSRFRPDQRALEDGNLELATPEKIRLEEKQREAYKRRKQNRQEWRCMWFQQRAAGVSQVKMQGDEEPAWVFNRQYWDARDRMDWEGCPDIM